MSGFGVTRYDWVIVDHVHDGDTIIAADIDLGLDTHRKDISLRFIGINSPELANPDGSGKAARDYLMTLVQPGQRISIDSISWDKYGNRIDARLFLLDASGQRVMPDLNSQMLASGHAVPMGPDQP
jgi:endonuclease YncB( thermonuclease family)